MTGDRGGAGARNRPAPSPLAGLPVTFVGSFPDPAHPLEPVQPEIAFLGRSNVGKSTLLNALLGRRLARTSATPGKTQLLNAFRLPMGYFLDLPGYGWARTSRVERRRFRALVDGVIVRRAHVAGVVWLLDIRHAPSRDDLAMRALLVQSDRPVLVTLTKADKLSRSRAAAAALDRASELALDPETPPFVVSAARGTGIAELGGAITSLMES